jgi:hypothetical protein
MTEELQSAAASPSRWIGNSTDMQTNLKQQMKQAAFVEAA